MQRKGCDETPSQVAENHLTRWPVLPGDITVDGHGSVLMGGCHVTHGKVNKEIPRPWTGMLEKDPNSK